MHPFRTFVLALVIVSGCATPGQEAPAETGESRWWKGNLHTHSLWSDGNDFPENITDWYRRNGYDFLAISDHNTLAEGERWIPVPSGSTREAALRRYRERFGDEWVEERKVGDTLQVRLRTLAEYRPLLEDPGDFLIIQSEEISARFEEKPLHVNATNLAERIEPRGGSSVSEVLQRNIDAVNEQRRRTGQPMVPHINHPNFRWAVTVEDMMDLEGERFFEVYNGHPLVHNEGDHHHPSTDRMWDIILAHRLSTGREVMYGLGVDDSHEYFDLRRDRSISGRGWIVVRAPELTAAAIIAAMERGDFYASSGVDLEDIQTTGDRLQIRIDAEPGVEYRTQFIGTRRGFPTESTPMVDSAGAPVSRRYSDEIGVVLAEVTGPSPSYRLRGDELYVRARIASSKLKPNGYREGEVEQAWTQPWVP